jgi:hypothetical protein
VSYVKIKQFQTIVWSNPEGQHQELYVLDDDGTLWFCIDYPNGEWETVTPPFGYLTKEESE